MHLKQSSIEYDYALSSIEKNFDIGICHENFETPSIFSFTVNHYTFNTIEGVILRQTAVCAIIAKRMHLFAFIILDYFL